MARIIYGMIALSLVASGCQRAKMRTTPVKPAPVAANPQPYSPPQWTPPPQPQPVQPLPPVEPVVYPTDDTADVNPIIPPMPVRPAFQPPPAVVDVPPPKCVGDCVTSREELPPPKKILVCGEGGPCPEIEPIAGTCEPVPFTGKPRKAELDIVFVVDTSASLKGNNRGNRGELEQLGYDLPNLLNKLDPNTKFNIGVIPAHGPATRYHGRLFQSERGEKLVLKYDDYARALGLKGESSADRVAIANAMAADLQIKMANVPKESKGAQGEALLYSLFTAVDNPSRRQEIQNAGLFRPEAALVVIMVTDEQDVCFDYENSNPKVEPVMKTVVNGQHVADPIETAFFERECKRAYRGELLKPEHVFKALTDMREGRPLFVTAIAYTDANIKPNPDLEDENEKAYGVLDLVGLSKTVKPINLADVVRDGNGQASFVKELESLGLQTAMQMKIENPIKCSSSVHPKAIDPSTVIVKVRVPDETQPLATFSGKCAQGGSCGNSIGWARSSVRREGRSLWLEVEMQSAPLHQLFHDTTVSRGTLHVEFRTLRGIDPKTGEPGEGSN